MLRSGGVWYGGQGVLCSGMASYGEIWSGELSRGGRGAFRCGAVRCGGAVVVRFGLVGSGAFRRSRLGVAQRGPMWRGVAQRDS